MKTTSCILIATAVAIGLGLGGWSVDDACQAAQKNRAPHDVAWFLRRMVDIEWLAHHKPGVRCKQFSSYDRRSRIDENGNKVNWEANGDAGNYLRTTREEGNVMAEMEGPGCITQFWSANPGGTIRIWLDGEKTPSVVIPMAELLSDKGGAPFKAPFSYQVREHPTHTASNCYFPIPYAKHCKIAVVGARMYYNIDYITYPKGTPIVTFKLPLTAEQQKVAQEVAAQIQKRLPILPTGLQQVTGQASAHEGQECDLVKVARDDGGIVRQLTIKADSPDKYRHRKAILRIYWDGSSQPGVVAPLGEFFGTGWFATPFASLTCRIDKAGTMTSYWPMPFTKSCRVTLTNLSMAPIAASASLKTSGPRKGCRCKPMYFHAMYRRENPSKVFDYPFLQDVVGPGRGVGNLLNIDNSRQGWWGEGDEKVWVDDDKFPSWYGTGSEDYFNDAWGMHLHDGPWEGCPLLQGPGHANKTSMYRWHILDSIPFEKQFTMTIENYYKRGLSDYSSVAYYYNMNPAGAAFFKPLTLADLLPCNFRPAGTIEAETLALPAAQKRTMEQLAEIGLADDASGTGAVELGVTHMMSSIKHPSSIPMGEVKPGVYRIHLHLLAKTQLPGLSLVPLTQPNVTLKPAKPPATTPPGSSVQTAGMLFVMGDKPVAVSPCLTTLARDVSGAKVLTVYLDAIRLETAPRRGMEAETLKWSSPDHLVTFKPDMGNTALSGWGQMKMETLSVGGLAAIPVKLEPGFYEVSGQLACGPDVGKLRIRMDLANTLVRTYDGYAPNPGLRVHGFGRFEVAKGKTLEQLEFMICGRNPKATDEKMAVDYLEIHPCRGLTGYEGEDMRLLKIEHGALGPQRLGRAFSRETQNFIRFNSVKGRIQLGFDLPKAGKYEVEMAFCKSHDYATIEAHLDGERIGPRMDNYSPTIVHSGPIKFGVVDLKAGTHVLEFRVVGKNDKSTGYYMGFDYLELLPAQ